MSFLSTYVRRFRLMRVDTGNWMLSKRWKSYRVLQSISVQEFHCNEVVNENRSKLGSGFIWGPTRRFVSNTSRLVFTAKGEIQYPSFYERWVVLFKILYIKFSIDKKFKIKEFDRGAIQAVKYLQRNLFTHNMSALSEVTTPSCLNGLLKNIEALQSEEEKQLLLGDQPFTISSILNISFQYPEKKTHNELLNLKILFKVSEPNLKIEEKSMNLLGLRQFYIEFERSYEGEQCTYWLISDVQILYDRYDFSTKT